MQVWHGKGYHYETDFLGEELAGSGGHLCCNEHTSVFMNTVMDVLLTILLGRKPSLALSYLAGHFPCLALGGLICSLLLNNIK